MYGSLAAQACRASSRSGQAGPLRAPLDAFRAESEASQLPGDSEVTEVHTFVEGDGIDQGLPSNGEQERVAEHWFKAAQQEGRSPHCKMHALRTPLHQVPAHPTSLCESHMTHTLSGIIHPL